MIPNTRTQTTGIQRIQRQTRESVYRKLIAVEVGA
jgi:hypothetical protein